MTQEQKPVREVHFSIALELIFTVQFLKKPKNYSGPSIYLYTRFYKHVAVRSKPLCAKTTKAFMCLKSVPFPVRSYVLSFTTLLFFLFFFQNWKKEKEEKRKVVTYARRVDMSDLFIHYLRLFHKQKSNYIFNIENCIIVYKKMKSWWCA